MTIKKNPATCPPPPAPCAPAIFFPFFFLPPADGKFPPPPLLGSSSQPGPIRRTAACSPATLLGRRSGNFPTTSNARHGKPYTRPALTKATRQTRQGLSSYDADARLVPPHLEKRPIPPANSAPSASASAAISLPASMNPNVLAPHRCATSTDIPQQTRHRHERHTPSIASLN